MTSHSLKWLPSIAFNSLAYTYFSFDFDRNSDRSLGLISDSHTFNVVVPFNFPIIKTILGKFKRILINCTTDMNVKCLLLIPKIK